MTQEQIVIQNLLDDGEVSRNWCLNLRITRLGAIICALNKEGWLIIGEWKTYNNGKDYIYYLKQAPEKLIFKPQELKQEGLPIKLAQQVYF